MSVSASMLALCCHAAVFDGDQRKLCRLYATRNSHIRAQALGMLTVLVALAGLDGVAPVTITGGNLHRLAPFFTNGQQGVHETLLHFALSGVFAPELRLREVREVFRPVHLLSACCETGFQQS